VDQSEIVVSLFLKTDEQLAKAIEKRVCDFNHPAPSLKIGIALFFCSFLASRADMSSILA